jgi:hypothetical protein
LAKAPFGHWKTTTFVAALRRGSLGVDLHRKSGEFPVSNEELDDAAATVYEGICGEAVRLVQTSGRMQREIE